MAQRLLLEVTQGALAGQIFAVPVNGTLLVGRLPECGLSIPQDLTVSRQHCRIEFHPPACRLVHLSQSSETRVNGTVVTEADLHAGDEVSFGAGNLLRVKFEEAVVEAGTPTASPGRLDRPTVKQMDRFTMSAVSCGWTVYASLEDQPGFERLLEILCRTQDLHALIDFRRIGQQRPPDLVEPSYLFSWLPAEAMDHFSPVFVSQTDCPNIADVVRSGWGKDGIVCFGSKLAGDELLMHWRQAIGAPGNKPGSAMTAYYWPSLLNMMLRCQSAEQLDPLLSGLSWLFVEAPDAPGNWNLYADEAFAGVLTSSGLMLADGSAE